MNMKKIPSFRHIVVTILFLLAVVPATAQQRRPVDSQHPLWLVHVDVWNAADPQKIINLIPVDIRPYVCMNLSLSCQYDKDRNLYKMPRCAVRTYKSWGTVCQQNGMWFTCQPASGGHTHIQDDDLETFEYFFKAFPNFLGWNYAEQFWGFDEAGDKSSSTQASRIALFAKLVPMHHQYGGFLTVSFCGNIWSHPLNPMGMMKRNKNLLQACKDYPEAILWLYKYTTSSCWYANESVTWGPFISGLAKNYGVRYDNCGWNGALDEIRGKEHEEKYPGAAGIGTVMEQTAMNGGAVWDGPELIWTEDFQNLNNSSVEGYTRRNWGLFPNFRGVWLDMFRQIIKGKIYIPTREEVLSKTKVVVINDKSSGSDEDKYAVWGNLYDGLYKQTDPFNRSNGQWMDNLCYFKSTGRYGTIPMVIALYDEAAKAIPVQVKKSAYTSRWGTTTKKRDDFNAQYPEVSKGDLFVERFRNQLVTYTPYSYLNKKTSAMGEIPLLYNTCDTLVLNYAILSSGLVREYADHIDIYLNNYRNDISTTSTDIIAVRGVTATPSCKVTKHTVGSTAFNATVTDEYADGVYTLSVEHNGPVTVTINCSGSREADTTLPLAGGDALEEPQQPAEYFGPVIIEAEDMDYKSVKGVNITNSGVYYPEVLDFAGNGFVDMGTSKSASLRHQLKCKHPGNYVIALRYTCTSKSGTITAKLNGTEYTIDCPKTAKNEWVKASFNAPLIEGTNNLILTNTGQVPMYADQIIYTPEGTAPEKFLVTVRDTEHGTVTPSVGEAAEGETVTLTVKADEGYKLKQLRVVNSVYYTLAKTIDVGDNPNEVTFVMPDDNVTLQPVFEDVSAVYMLDFTSVEQGTIPKGWRCVQENNEVHEWSNSYGSGARTFSGFSGYQGKALYWRNKCAEYGRQSASPLTLSAGKYKLTYAMAAWKGSPKYKLQLLNASTGAAVVETSVFTASPNADGSTSANVKSATKRELEFTITDAGKYVISFTDESTADGLHEFLLLECRVNTVGPPSGIELVDATGAHVVNIYDAAGRHRPTLGRGLNIVRTSDGKTRKVLNSKP